VASSSSVYGVPKDLPCDEDHPKSPISVYGTSKLASEAYCNMFYRMFVLPVTLLRYHTVYGPRQRPDMAIHKFVDTLSHGKSPTIFGDGNQTRDFTYVSDAVEGTILAAETENTSGETFNIGSGSQISVNHVIELIKRLVNKTEINQVYTTVKVGDVPDTYADIQKAKKILNYNPKSSFEKGLKSFLDWYFDRS